MVTIEIDGEYGDDDGNGGGVHISDEHGEIVMWDSQEWIDEPSLVFVIASAIREAYENGPASLRLRVGNTVATLTDAQTGHTYPSNDPRYCQSHISCPDHDGALYWCGRYLNHTGWHVGGYNAIITDPRPDLHRWNDTGRIEHI